MGSHYILLCLVFTIVAQGYSLGNLNVNFITNDIVRVSFKSQGSKIVNRTSLVVTAWFPPVPVTVVEYDNKVTVSSTTLMASIDKKTLTVSFQDLASGRVLLEEAGRTSSPVNDNGNTAYAVTQSWKTDSAESWYGLGAFQNNFIDYRAAPIRLIQFNTEDINPYLVSTGGYGILWDMYSVSYLNKPSQIVNSNATSFVAPVAGRYYFHVTYYSDLYPVHQHVVNLTVDGKTIIHYFMYNVPNTLTGFVDLPAGTFPLTFTSTGDPLPTLYVRGPSESSVSTLSADNEYFGIDYYFTRGGSVDETIAQYRILTGAASLYPKWVFGFWQCKEHYHNQSELLGAAAEFRARNLPIDTIVQDWQYWGSMGWGPQWDPTIYPNPPLMVDTLHKQNIHLMVSVWSRFDPSTVFYKNMSAAGYLIPNSQWMDPYNKGAREMFFSFANRSMFSIGVDALWLDATEPEDFPNANVGLSIGSGNAYMGPFALMVTTAVQDGLLQTYPNRRVFSLTRSTFAGQQRTGGMLWSGDTDGTWDTLRRQVTHSINYQLSGNPYWTQDIGGFFRPDDQYTNPDYQTLLVRWFQFGVFTPVFRVHGGGSNTEYWNYGDQVLKLVNDTNNLRYRLLPYIYSLSLQITRDHYTLQRALVFDFPDDSIARHTSHQFMFGPSLLVAPMVSSDPTREVYFPKGTWYDFFQGTVFQGPGVSVVSVGIDTIPLYGRGGTMLLLGPYLQYTTEKLQNVTEVRIFRGGDSTFTLLEDDGESANSLSTGAYTSTRLSWNDSTCTFTAHRREGVYIGMVFHRQFQIVMVRPGYGVGIAPSNSFDAVLNYDGHKASVQLPC